MADVFSLHRLEYGADPEVIASAPGVVNLMGEHTDYNDGYVLQIALNRTVEVAVSRRKDNSLKFYASDVNERKRTTIANLKYKREDRWANYSKGVIALLLQMGMAIKGVDITIRGTVPQGIGLGSSSALCVATAAALKNLFGLKLKDMQLISVAGRAESEFIGLDTRVTDAFVSCISRKDSAVFLDLRTLEHEFLPFNHKDLKLFIVNSNVPQFSIEADLNERKASCKECVEYLNKRKPGTSLRDYSSQDLKQGMGVVPEPLRRLCMHVVEENERVLESRELLAKKDVLSFGKVMNRSHESLRDQYEVSCPEIDWLVKRASEIEGVLGSRLTGPGFGGCTVSIIKDHAIDRYVERLSDYEHIFGFDAEFFACDPSPGVKIIYPA